MPVVISPARSSSHVSAFQLDPHTRPSPPLPLQALPHYVPLVISYLAAYYCREAVMATDFVAWATCGKLPMMDAPLRCKDLYEVSGSNGIYISNPTSIITLWYALVASLQGPVRGAHCGSSLLPA